MGSRLSRQLSDAVARRNEAKAGRGAAQLPVKATVLRRQAFRIVGEDEADPRNGSVSYVSPVARALIGRAAGDVVSAQTE